MINAIRRLLSRRGLASLGLPAVLLLAACSPGINQPSATAPASGPLATTAAAALSPTGASAPGGTATGQSGGSGEIMIDAPQPGATVANGTEVRGRVAVVPPQKLLAFRVIDQTNTLLGEGQVMVSGEPGQAGTFAVPLSFRVGAAGAGRIEVLDLTASDGTLLAPAALDVVLDSSGAPQMVAQPTPGGQVPVAPPQGPTPGPLPTDPAPASVVPDAPPVAPPPPGARPAQRTITIDSPVEGQVVPVPIELRGQVSVVPFENNLVYRIYDTAGTPIGEGPILVEGQQGQSGTFVVVIDIPVGAAGPLRIEVVDLSASDGSVLASASVNVMPLAGP